MVNINEYGSATQIKKEEKEKENLEKTKYELRRSRIRI
tara:strand:- start:340 stop:453 length:114 start_codon:yes stop_codon:yes gene_type:complete